MQNNMKDSASCTLMTRDMALCGLFAALIAAGAFIKISIPVQPDDAVLFCDPVGASSGGETLPSFGLHVFNAGTLRFSHLRLQRRAGLSFKAHVRVSPGIYRGSLGGGSAQQPGKAGGDGGTSGAGICGAFYLLCGGSGVLLSGGQFHLPGAGGMAALACQLRASHHSRGYGPVFPGGRHGGADPAFPVTGFRPVLRN